MTEVFAASEPSREAVTSLGALELMINASTVVQLVLLLLVIFSICAWGIIFSKWMTVRGCYRATEEFIDIFWSGRSMDFIYSESKKFRRSPVAKIFQSGYIELQRLMEKERAKVVAPNIDAGRLVPPESAIQNLERALHKANRSQTMELEKSLSFLATAGSTAPFIGLFGTVWGIMNSFQNIGVQGGASLAIVAPGIAEALIATAVGLACAIPAVMGYNYFIQRVRDLRTQMDNFSSDFLNIVKRNFLAG